MNKIVSSFSKLLPDKLYLQLMYYKRFHSFIDFKNPRTYNEKLQWLKINDRKNIYTKMVDKIGAKEYVSEKIGPQYVVPLLKIYEDVNEIRLEDLPETFVLKCNHDSQSIAICRNKKEFNIDEAKKMLKKRKKNNGFWYGREWPYKNVEAKIFAEKYIDGIDDQKICDYKLFCFNGKAKLCQVHMGRFTGRHTQDFYFCEDGQWEKNQMSHDEPTSNEFIDRPKFLDEMIKLSEDLSKGTYETRIDWVYKDQLYFGEITLFCGAGFIPFGRYEDDVLLGSWIDLKNRY